MVRRMGRESSTTEMEIIIKALSRTISLMDRKDFIPASMDLNIKEIFIKVTAMVMEK